MGEQGQAQDWNSVKVLGRGSFGEVLLLRNGRNGNLMAVKKFHVPRHYSCNENSSSNFQSRCGEEVRMMYTIDHPNIVATITPSPELVPRILEILGNSTSSSPNDQYVNVNFSCGSSSGSESLLPGRDKSFLCMEYCSGGDLRGLLRRPEHLSGLPEKLVRDFLAHISDALMYLHGLKIIHRDIKPENIIIQHGKANGELIFKLSDLGLAKDVSSKESLCSSFVGTLAYIAPEIFYRKKYDKLVDYWSFGIIAFEVTCGLLPFMLEESLGHQFRNHQPLQDSSLDFPREIPRRSHLSEFLRSSLSTWTDTMLQRDPKRRERHSISSSAHNRAGPAQMCSLKYIKKILGTQYLEFPTFSGRFSYPIRSGTTVQEVQTWLGKDVNIVPEKQLILTREGSVLKPGDLVINYLKVEGRGLSQLHLIHRGGEQVSMKIVLPQLLSVFLSNVKSPDIIEEHTSRQIWNSTLFHVQTQLERTKAVVVAWEVFLRRQNSVDVKLDKNDYESLKLTVRKKLSKLSTLIELEERFEELEATFERHIPFNETLSSIKQTKREWTPLMEDLENILSEQSSTSTKEDTIRPLDLTPLEKRYQNLLQEYDMWRVATSKRVPYSMNSLRTLLCLFLTDQQTLLSTINSNFNAIFKTLIMHQDKLQSSSKQLDTIINQILTGRLNRQKHIMEMAYPKYPLPVFEVESYPTSQSLKLSHPHYYLTKEISSKGAGGSAGSSSNNSSLSDEDTKGHQLPRERSVDDHCCLLAPSNVDTASLIESLWDKIQIEKL